MVFPLIFLKQRPLSCEISFSSISFHSLSALSLSCLQTVRLSSRGRVCPIQVRGTSPTDYPPFISCPVTSFLYLNLNRFSRNAWTSRASPTFSPALNSNRLPNGPPPSHQQPKETGLFPPLNQQNGARPQETDPTLQSLTGLIVRACVIPAVITH